MSPVECHAHSLLPRVLREAFCAGHPLGIFVPKYSVMQGVAAIDPDKAPGLRPRLAGCMLQARCLVVGHLFSTVGAFYGGLVLGIFAQTLPHRLLCCGFDCVLLHSTGLDIHRSILERPCSCIFSTASSHPPDNLDTDMPTLHPRLFRKSLNPPLPSHTQKGQGVGATMVERCNWEQWNRLPTPTHTSASHTAVFLTLRCFVCSSSTLGCVPPPPPCAGTALSKHMSPCYRRFDGIF